MSPPQLLPPRKLSAATALPASSDIVARVREATGGGAHVSLDVLGRRPPPARGSSSLRPRGRHVQGGTLVGDDADPALPIGCVIAQELQILGSHGLAVAEYAELLDDIASGRLDLAGTVGRVIDADPAGRW